MKIDRYLVIALLSLTTVGVVLQGITLYRQFVQPESVQRQRPAFSAIQIAPAGTTLEMEGIPVIGDSVAKVVLAEFSDYECPFCARHATDVGKVLRQRFVEPGLLKYAFFNNPLPIHSNAKFLATAAICAGNQQKYWEMHDRIFASKVTSRDAVMSTALDLSLDVAEFEQCLKVHPFANERIAKDMAKAKELRFGGTPAFAIGRVNTNGSVTVSKLILGAQSVSVFEEAIKSEIEAATRN